MDLQIYWRATSALAPTAPPYPWQEPRQRGELARRLEYHHSEPLREGPYAAFGDPLRCPELAPADASISSCSV